MLVALAVPGFWLRRSASNTMLVACTKYAGWRRSSPLAMPQAGGDRPPWLCLNSGYAALLAMPQFWLRRPRPVARCSLPKVCRLAELVPPGYAYILAAEPSTRFPWLCLDSGCAALNSGCAATNSGLLPNSSLRYAAVLAAAT